MGEVEGAGIGGGGAGQVAQPAVEVGDGGVEQVVAVHAGLRADAFQCGQAGPRTLQHGEGHRPVERHYRRRRQRRQLVIVRQNALPVGGFVRGRDGVAGGDGSLRVVCGQLVVAGGLRELAQAQTDHVLVPAGAVLLVEQQRVALGVGAGG